MRLDIHILHVCGVAVSMPQMTQIGIFIKRTQFAKVAMSFGLIACIVGTAAMAALWPITCCPYGSVWIRCIVGMVDFAFGLQLATFSMFGTEYCNMYECRLGWGGIVSILVAVMWLVGAIGVWMIPKPIERNETTNENVNTTDTMPKGCCTMCCW